MTVVAYVERSTRQHIFQAEEWHKHRTGVTENMMSVKQQW